MARTNNATLTPPNVARQAQDEASKAIQVLLHPDDIESGPQSGFLGYFKGKFFGVTSPRKSRQQGMASEVDTDDQKEEDVEKQGGAGLTHSLQAIKQTSIVAPRTSSSARAKKHPEDSPAPTIPKSLSRPTTRPASLANTPKRKRFVERPDTYEVPTETLSAVLDEEEDDRPARRTRVKNIAKSKPPIVQAKTSRGQPRPVPVKHSNVEQITGVIQMEEAYASESSSLPNVVLSAETPVKPRRGRGRPPKRTHSPLRLSEELVISAPRERGPPQLKPSQPQHPILSINLNPEEGISDILLNPSPVKLTQDTAKLKLSKRAKEKQREMISVSDSEAEEVTPQIDIDNDLAANVDDEPDNVVSLTKGQLIDPEYIEGMLHHVKHVGYNRANERVRVEKTTHTPEGKRMVVRLDRLAVLYETYGKQKSSGDDDLLKATEDRISDGTKSLGCEYQQVMEKRLGDPLDGVPGFNQNNTKEILTDIYFQIAVRYISTLKIFARVHGRGGTMTTPRLQEFLKLLDQLYALLSTAVNQRKASQPQSKGYQIQKPVRRTIPMVRGLRDKIRKEIRSRAKEEERERLRPERARIQHEENLRDKAELRLQRNASNQAVRRALEAGLTVPDWGRLLAQSLRPSELKYQEASQHSGFSANTGRVRSSRPRYASEQYDQDDVENNPFEDNHNFQRVSVFPTRTASEAETAGPRPLSRQEKHIFIEYMRDDREEDRYERLAQRLNRSMDDIFDYAKEFQQAMDIQHERGLLNDPETEGWTWKIWVERE